MHDDEQVEENDVFIIRHCVDCRFKNYILKMMLYAKYWQTVSGGIADLRMINEY